MSKEVTTISPEGLEVANCYLQYGNINAVVQFMGVSEDKVVSILNKREIKKYIDTVYLDLGYRNKNNIASLLDEMIESKLEEAKETGVYSSKDLADLLQMAHKMRMDEIKAQAEIVKAEGTRILLYNTCSDLCFFFRVKLFKLSGYSNAPFSSFFINHKNPISNVTITPARKRIIPPPAIIIRLSIRCNPSSMSFRRLNVVFHLSSH